MNNKSFLPWKNLVSHVTRFFPGTYKFQLSNAQVFLFFSFLILKSLFNNFLFENMSTCILSVFINTTFFNWASTFENNCGDAYQLSKWIFKILEGAMKNTKGTIFFNKLWKFKVSWNRKDCLCFGFAKFAIEYST